MWAEEKSLLFLKLTVRAWKDGGPQKMANVSELFIFRDEFLVSGMVSFTWIKKPRKIQLRKHLHTVDGWNLAPVEVGSLSHYLLRFYTSQVVIAGFLGQCLFSPDISPTFITLVRYLRGSVTLGIHPCIPRFNWTPRLCRTRLRSMWGLWMASCLEDEDRWGIEMMGLETKV